MTFRSKLLFAQLPIGVALILVSLLFVRTLRALGTDSQTILKDNFLSVQSVHTMDAALEALQRGVLARLEGEPAMDEAAFETSFGRFESALRIEEGNVTEPGEGQATARIRKGWEGYRRALRDLLAHPSGPQYREGIAPELARIHEGSEQVLALNMDAIVRKNDRVQSLVSRNETVLLFATLIACVLGLFATGALTSRLLHPLGVLSQTVRRVGEGDLNARVVAVGKDEIALLAQEFNAMTARMQSYQQSSLGELLEAQESAQAAIDSLSDPVLAFDVKGELVNANESAARLLGIDVDAGAPKKGIADEGVQRAVERAKQHALGGHGALNPKGFDEAVAALTPEGQRYFLARSQPVYSSASGITGVTVVLQDVTRVRLFDELTSDVVATVAHEFRTPLTSLRMAIHLCLDGVAGGLTAKQEELLYAARDDAARLQTMVDDLLNVARIQAGTAALHARKVEVQELIEAALAAHRDEARAKGVEVRAEPSPQGLTLEADLERLMLVFNNLLNNAIQHTPGGGHVDLRVRAEPEHVVFEVEDTGPGIPAEYLPRVFDKFFQVPGAAGGAAGLGLYIAQEVVRAHRGEIGARSAPGQGTTFWFRLPLRADAAAR